MNLYRYPFTAARLVVSDIWYSQGQLASSQPNLQAWHSVFQGVAANAGIPLEPAAILAHLQQTHQQAPASVAPGSTATEDISHLRQRESQLQAQLMEKILENMELRRHLQSAKAAAEPNVVQVGCLNHFSLPQKTQ